MSDEASQTQGTAPVDFVSLAPGRMIGRYEVVAVLGQGGFGITYRARDAQLGREVAIKEYLPLALAVRQDGTTVQPRSTTAAPDFAWGRDRFVAEGRTLASLQNAPGIVRVFDFLEANGTAYIVMQLLQGETLESRLKQGTLSPAAIDRILWPLLDGLEQVHNAGFLHRDIKPANILLDAAGQPTLIDFGASRAAVAGRSTALTAVFTPGYAAGEQMTSARQGPWTDIYSLSATLYHAITGAAPPSAFDRMLDDEYRPLAKKAPPGFGRGLLIGLDAGLAVRASDRPQSIAGWRPILGLAAASDAIATVAMTQSSPPAQPAVAPPPAAVPPPDAASSRAGPKKRMGQWIGGAVVAVLLLGGGYYGLVDDKRAPSTAAQDAQLAAEAQRLKDQEELALLRAENERRQKAEQEAAQRRQIEEETRRKLEAEMADRKRREEEARQKADAEAAAKKRQEEEARLKAEADAAAQRQVDEAAKKVAEAGESGLRLSVLDRQHVQVALIALGFATGNTNGTLGSRSREMIAAWQKSRNEPATGYLTGAQNQALLRDAAPAIARFDEERKLEEARRKAEEDKAKTEAASRPPPPPAAPAPPPPAAAPVAPNVAAAVSRSGPDGLWAGTYRCSPSRVGGAEFNFKFQIMLSGGTGTWIRPGSESGTMVGNQSLSVRVTGAHVVVSRVFTPGNRVGMFQTATMSARFEGNSITGSGPEHNSAGRTCDIALTRAQ